MSSTEPAAGPAAVDFGGVCPILRVGSLADSVRYYTDVLGFSVDWEDPDGMVSVSRGKCCLFLTEYEQSKPGSWVWIGVNDVDPLHEELVGRGAIIRQAPANFSWAWEMQVADPDGNVLRIGSSPKPGVPYGPWRDGRGDLWLARPDGSWVRDESAGAKNA